MYGVTGSIDPEPNTILGDNKSYRIAKRKPTDDQVRVTGYIHDLELRNRKAEQANDLKTEFLTNMSHELRSPLHTIIGFSELLAEQIVGPLNAKQSRFVSHIQEDSLHLLNLINDLLDLSKIEAGSLEIRHESLETGAVIEEVVASVLPRATAKSVEIQSDFPIATSVLADRLRFKQILHNLLGNAIKFTPSGGKVSVKTVTRGGFAEISVSDTGIGVPEDQQQAVFDKFYQIKAATTGGSEGTGLGLAITKRLVEQHGGNIWLWSEPGSGSCFTFTIPLIQQAYENGANSGR